MSHSLPPGHPFAASITPNTGVWTGARPTPLVNWDVICPPSQPRAERKRPLGLPRMFRSRSVDAPQLANIQTATIAPPPKAAKTTKPPKRATVVTPTPTLRVSTFFHPPPVSAPSPKTPEQRTTPPRRLGRRSPTSPSSPASTNILTPPSFLNIRHLPSLPNLRRKRPYLDIPDFVTETSPPPVGYEWAPRHLEQIFREAATQPAPAPQAKRIPVSAAPLALAVTLDTESPERPEPYDCRASPDPRADANAKPDKRTRRHGQIFSAGFAHALRGKIESSERERAGAHACEKAFEDALLVDTLVYQRDMMARLCTLGVL